MGKTKTGAAFLVLCAVIALALLVVHGAVHSNAAAGPPLIIPYDPAHPAGLQCVAGRVVAETDPCLSARQRAAMWRQYGLRLEFEWLVPQTGFTYHELAVRPWTAVERAHALLTRRVLAPRRLPQLIALLRDDSRLHWAAPDALLLEWDRQIAGEPGAAGAGEPAATSADSGYGVTLLDGQYHAFTGGLEDWAQHADWPEPMPDFEYYRLCAPDGTAVTWAPQLMQNAVFSQHCATLYGTGQARALAQYAAAGSPQLAPVTVCVADTGVFVNHPDLAVRLHPNAIDANYSNFSVAAAGDRPTATEELRQREGAHCAGMPRPAIKGQPAAHGTCVAGIIARCTDGFGRGEAQVRILPASLKSDRTYAIVGTRIKTPISAFIKLVAALYANFPVGSFTPTADAAVQNTGDVRVVSTSASVPRTYFSDAEWRVVSSLANKGAAAILEDLRVNDRVYVFAAGNEAQGAPSKPGELDCVIAVSASMAFDAGKPWYYGPTGEGSNLGGKCVSAPGHAIITSTLYKHPNLAYLPDNEIPQPRASQAVPKREHTWVMQTNRFSATSAATPQVAALAALLIAQDPSRTYRDVITRITDSTAGRQVQGEWGQAHGLIDYAWALAW